MAQAGSVLLNHSELQDLELLQDEAKAESLLKMMEDLTAVDGAKFTLDLSVKENSLYI